jgi:hypothetical protein
MQPDVVLLPQPRRITRLAGSCATRDDVRESIDPARVVHSQGYELRVEPSNISIRAHDPAGTFYGRQTLAQLRRQFPRELPCLHIEDWPDFPARGVMLDISRDKVPTMATLFMLADMFAHLKINQLQLYTEHTFAYSQHAEVWKDASPMTADEIRQLDAYCRERFIELVPNQNSFGHMERWLKHERYKPLAEKPDGFMFPWNFWHEGGFSLNPLDPRSLELIEGLYDELLPNFTSRMFNVGCDETFDVGLGKSKAECEKRGKERVYLDFLLKIHRAVSERGRRCSSGATSSSTSRADRPAAQRRDRAELGLRQPPVREGDARVRAGGRGVLRLPRHVELDVDQRQDRRAIENLRSAAEHGLKNGATGYLNTDWGDFGHLQYLPISFLGFALGAAYSVVPGVEPRLAAGARARPARLSTIRRA